MEASVYSVPVAASPGSTPNCSSGKREFLGLSRTASSFASRGCDWSLHWPQAECEPCAALAGFELHAVGVRTAQLTLMAGSLPGEWYSSDHPSSHAAAQISEAMDSAGIAEPTSVLSNPAAMSMSTIPQESKALQDFLHLRPLCNRPAIKFEHLHKEVLIHSCRIHTAWTTTRHD